jgi:cardiolipin synthase
MRISKKHVVYAALISAGATLVATLLFTNFAGGEKKIEQKLPRLYEADDGEFRRSLSALLGPPVLEGNRVETLVNGDRIFPPMLQAIRQAKRTITFETYIYWSGEIGREFVDALSERARAGVKVHVLLDWVGSIKMEDALIETMKSAGIQVERFHQPHWANLSRMNNRTHRKLLVTDGRVGFTGGVGIADQWRGDARNPDEWRDMHFRVEGPVVAQMQAVFMDNWIRATGRVLHGDDYFPTLTAVGDQPAQMFSSSPSGGAESMHLMYLLAITAAKHTIELSASYFVPDDIAIRALADAAQRGVKVRVITPGEHIDAETVRRASRARWGELLEAGVQIAEYAPTMFHVKGLVVDGLIASVGSTNFDNRSFRLNDEANLNVMHRGFAERQREVFEADWTKSKPITLEAWRNRPWQEKLWEHAASMLGAQL